MSSLRMGRLGAAPVPKSGETFVDLVRMAGVVVEEIASSAAPARVEYRQEHDEWVVVVDGEAELDVDGTRLVLRAGDWVLLPAVRRIMSCEQPSAPAGSPCMPASDHGHHPLGISCSHARTRMAR